MKKSLALLLASAFLVFALTACGGDKKENGSTASDTPTTEDTLDDPDSSVTDEILDGSDTAEDHRDTTEDGLFGTDNQTPNDGTTDPVPGDDTTTDNHTSDQKDTVSGTDPDTGSKSARFGASYSQMLENARVHDTDGDLTDYENAVTPGAAAAR